MTHDRRQRTPTHSHFYTVKIVSLTKWSLVCACVLHLVLDNMLLVSMIILQDVYSSLVPLYIQGFTNRSVIIRICIIHSWRLDKKNNEKYMTSISETKSIIYPNYLHHRSSYQKGSGVNCFICYQITAHFSTPSPFLDKGATKVYPLIQHY